MTQCLLACGKKEPEAKLETIDGVTYVHNPATPLHPSRSVSFEEEFIYEETEQAGEIRLLKPGGFAVDAAGNVYIADESDMAIKVFDQAGKCQRTIGRRGEGPGEFTSIRYFFPCPTAAFLLPTTWLDIFPEVLVGGKMYLMDEDETTGMRRVKRYHII